MLRDVMHVDGWTAACSWQILRGCSFSRTRHRTGPWRRRLARRHTPSPDAGGAPPRSAPRATADGIPDRTLATQTLPIGAHVSPTPSAIDGRCSSPWRTSSPLVRFCALVADADGVILSSSIRGSAFQTRRPASAWSAGPTGASARAAPTPSGPRIAERAPGRGHRRSPLRASQRRALLLRVAGLRRLRRARRGPRRERGAAARHPSLARSVQDAAAALERALREMAYKRAGFHNLGVLERLVLGAGAPTLLVEPAARCACTTTPRARRC